MYPVLIQPCFNTVAELPAGDVRSAVERLAASVSYPLKKLYSVDGSKRSTHSNAYLYGFCGSKRIVLYDTLLAQCTPQQIVAVLAHELGHWHHSHVLVGLGLNELVTVITFYVMRFFLYSGELYDAFGMAERPLFIGAMLFFFVYDPISQVQMLVANALMRRFENQADDYALRLGYGEVCDGFFNFLCALQIFHKICVLFKNFHNIF